MFVTFITSILWIINSMKVFKFGGASVKSAEAVRNLAGILGHFNENLIVVVSAMGKTTNAMEELARLFFAEKDYSEAYNKVRDFHMDIVRELFPDPLNPVYAELDLTFRELATTLKKSPSLNFDFDYDQVVSFGEILSTRIVASYLNQNEIKVRWTDIRKYLKTDNTYREALVDWELSTGLIKKAFHFEGEKIFLTQGFLGSTINNLTTTLGREGSDYTAAILAYILDAESVAIWKDVPGVLNADPKWFDNCVRLEQLSYLDAIELAYYGATVIHPKTIKPLQNKNIKLHVKSFLNPQDPGTVIGDVAYESLIPSFIFKMDQVLILISPLDLSFIAEDRLKTIFGHFSRHNLKINLMQNSAVSFKVCVNNDQTRIPNLLNDLRKDFKVSIDTGLELITIRYYDEKTIERVMVNKDLVLEQRSKTTVQLVVKDRG
jgi:aspartate kinase